MITETLEITLVGQLKQKHIPVFKYAFKCISREAERMLVNMDTVTVHMH